MSTKPEAGAEVVREWPDHDLIYVRDARRRHVQIGSGERVFGIFSRRYDSDGNEYFYPVERRAQDGVQPHWLLDPKYDLILDWEPVDVADLLERMRGRD
ncbi:hypothetical protein [Actinomyces oris]|uniref:hypothetical protein n=1 Tax=Actinomyces oris TaxID=544580 RepID=UPI00288ABC18|nr:hypothetical protein [Actinomyces oris]